MPSATPKASPSKSTSYAAKGDKKNKKPPSKGTTWCVHFIQGKCTSGSACNYSHDVDPKSDQAKKCLERQPRILYQ